MCVRERETESERGSACFTLCIYGVQEGLFNPRGGGGARGWVRAVGYHYHCGLLIITSPITQHWLSCQACLKLCWSVSIASFVWGTYVWCEVDVLHSLRIAHFERFHRSWPGCACIQLHAPVSVASLSRRLSYLVWMRRLLGITSGKQNRKAGAHEQWISFSWACVALTGCLNALHTAPPDCTPAGTVLIQNHCVGLNISSAPSVGSSILCASVCVSRQDLSNRLSTKCGQLSISPFLWFKWQTPPKWWRHSASRLSISSIVFNSLKT